MLVLLALAQLICSFAGSNMNVAISSISKDLGTILVSDLAQGNRSYALAMTSLAVVGVIGLAATLFLHTEPVPQE